MSSIAGLTHQNIEIPPIIFVANVVVGLSYWFIERRLREIVSYFNHIMDTRAMIYGFCSILYIL